MSDTVTLDLEPSGRSDRVIIHSNQRLTPDAAEVYADPASGENGSPLAQLLFCIEGITALTLDGGDLIITHDPGLPIFTLLDEVRGALNDFFL